MSEFKIIFAILHTSALTAAKIKELHPDTPDDDARNLEKVFSLMDGQKAVMCPSLGDGDDYSFCGIADKSVDREVSYLLEQDSWCGCYINEREDFDKEYDSGEYSRDVQFCIEKEYVEVISHEEWEALVRAEQSGGEANAKD